jgi:dihydropyrimidine dehydrogenase (NAD+) subunit PreT
VSSSAPRLPEDRLETRLPDAKPLFSRAEAVVEANRCLYCHDAPCVAACPTGIDVPTFIRRIGSDNVRGAARTILSANVLGFSCARVCPVEVLCVGACVYNAWHRDPPIAIGRLQRYATEDLMRQGRATELLARAPANGKRVACVGAGPASLACATYLALEGFAVTIYEKRPFAGGLNTSGVAPYKLPAEDSLAEVEFVRALGVAIRTGVEVASGPEAEALLREHDAVFLAPGLGSDTRLGIPCEDGAGVVGAVEWIERMKIEPGARIAGVRRAVVIGGGNTAIDAARELAGLGVPSVSMLYRRTTAEMSGYAHELEQARLAGVVLVDRAVPARFERDAQRALTGVTLESGETHACDLAIVAIGQARIAELARAFPGVERDGRGALVADPVSGATGHPRVFAGGDAVHGGELVVTAVQDGKRAARGICAALGVTIRPDSPMRAGRD